MWSNKPGYGLLALIFFIQLIILVRKKKDYRLVFKSNFDGKQESSPNKGELIFEAIALLFFSLLMLYHALF